MATARLVAPPLRPPSGRRIEHDDEVEIAVPDVADDRDERFDIETARRPPLSTPRGSVSTVDYVGECR